jgi:hypothetical protein
VLIHRENFKFMQSYINALVKAWDSRCFTHLPRPTKIHFPDDEVSSNLKKSKITLMASSKHIAIFG